MFEHVKKTLIDAIVEIADLDPELILLVLLVVVALVRFNRFSAIAREKQEDSGLDGKVPPRTVSVDGSPALPIKDYVSEMQGLAGKPDAVISENGYIIPIERKPLARKIHDRYVAQLLVYMRLIEEFEGKKPPYGYLILGPNKRRVKIENSEARQAWVQKILDEMRGILEKSAPAIATPHPKKCARCDVRAACQYRGDT